jgi:hypothetical protein
MTEASGIGSARSSGGSSKVSGYAPAATDRIGATLRTKILI